MVHLHDDFQDDVLGSLDGLHHCENGPVGGNVKAEVGFVGRLDVFGGSDVFDLEARGEVKTEVEAGKVENEP